MEYLQPRSLTKSDFFVTVVPVVTAHVGQTQCIKLFYEHPNFSICTLTRLLMHLNMASDAQFFRY
ncbi:hypothetical protein T4A_980 [Trichinella pseudospiralis]|uniref:Uncharacterized protein n=1 Tax=Trichinella pseudospiralis TaxID=6337 RepID=A0A0V1DY89_TRIPS|nr:hypothetical protein T4A_980 [Trichinella pseudospiralis]